MTTQQTQATAAMTAQDFSTFAYAVCTIMTAYVHDTYTIDHPLKMGFAVGDFHVEVEFHYRGKFDHGAFADPIWDQVMIGGKSCGNRAGGRDEFTRLVFEHFAAKAVA